MVFKIIFSYEFIKIYVKSISKSFNSFDINKTLCFKIIFI